MDKQECSDQWGMKNEEGSMEINLLEGNSTPDIDSVFSSGEYLPYNFVVNC